MEESYVSLFALLPHRVHLSLCESYNLVCDCPEHTCDVLAVVGLVSLIVRPSKFHRKRWNAYPETMTRRPALPSRC